MKTEVGEAILERSESLLLKRLKHVETCWKHSPFHQITTSHHKSSRVITSHHKPSQVITSHHKSSRVITRHARYVFLPRMLFYQLIYIISRSRRFIDSNRWTGDLMGLDLSMTIGQPYKGFSRITNCYRCVCLSYSFLASDIFVTSLISLVEIAGWPWGRRLWGHRPRRPSARFDQRFAHRGFHRFGRFGASVFFPATTAGNVQCVMKWWSQKSLEALLADGNNQ